VLALVLAHARSAGAEDTERHGAEGGMSRRVGAGSQGREAGHRIAGQDRGNHHRRQRVGELARQTEQLERKIAEQDRLLRESREDYRARVRATYKGEP